MFLYSSLIQIDPPTSLTQPFSNKKTSIHATLPSQNLSKWWWVHPLFTFTPWKFNSSPLKIGRTPKGNDRLPTIIFQGRAVKLWGCISSSSTIIIAKCNRSFTWGHPSSTITFMRVVKRWNNPAMQLAKFNRRLKIKSEGGKNQTTKTNKTQTSQFLFVLIISCYPLTLSRTAPSSASRIMPSHFSPLCYCRTHGTHGFPEKNRFVSDSLTYDFLRGPLGFGPMKHFWWMGAYDDILYIVQPAPSSRGANLTLRDSELTPCNGTM